jgi:tRNA modification GTPase
MRLTADDTIAAVATPPGAGGVGIVRVSGPDAVSIVTPLFRPHGKKSLAQAPSHHLLYGWIERSGEPLDEVLAVVMRAPHSYTRQDVVEVHCHGGPLVTRTVLELTLAGGARLAQPGEFTMRAFLNGRLDLTRAEAVQDMVEARSGWALRASANQLRGRLYTAIQELREHVAQVAALVAAGIDFPEEDVVFAHRAGITSRLQGVERRLESLLATAVGGRRMREGLAVAIVGRPNVGKSSLLNALLKENRAIVSEIPGTTRDTVEESLDLNGLAIRLIDTAGIRETAELVEREGIVRTRRAADEADLVLAVLDGSAPLTVEDRQVLTIAQPGATLAVINKRDRMPTEEPSWISDLKGMPRVTLSALHGDGLEDLESWIQHWAVSDERPLFEQAVLTNLRQQHAAQGALGAVRSALAAIDDRLGDEMIAVDLTRALDALGDIVGETTADDLLNRIFAEFCIGK